MSDLKKFFSSVTSFLTEKIIPFAAKYFLVFVTWLISAIVTLALLIYAVGRTILYGVSITKFIKNLIPNKRISDKTNFGLLLVEVADSIKIDISARLKFQYEKILSFFKPLQ